MAGSPFSGMLRASPRPGTPTAVAGPAALRLPEPPGPEGAGRRPRPLGFKTRAENGFGGWWARGAPRRGRAGGLGQVELMQETERYNEVDCRVMAKVIGYLREHH